MYFLRVIVRRSVFFTVGFVFYFQSFGIEHFDVLRSFDVQSFDV
jgi:hypothetical protein